MPARRALLGPADGKGCGFEVDLVPAASQPARLSLSRAGKRPDHGRVPLAPAIGPGGISQDWHLAGAWV